MKFAFHVVTFNTLAYEQESDVAISTITAAGAFVIAIGAAALGSRLYGDSPEAGASADLAYALTTCTARPDVAADANGQHRSTPAPLSCSDPMPPGNLPRGSWESLAQAFPR